MATEQKIEFTEDLRGHTMIVGPTRLGMSVISELLTNDQLRHGGKPVVVDKGSSMDQLGEPQ